MQGTPYDLVLENQQAFLRQETDTAHPTTPIPLFFIHSFEQPFCADVTCPCHAQRREVQAVFVKIVEGHFELEPAAHFLELNEEGK